MSIRLQDTMKMAQLQQQPQNSVSYVQIKQLYYFKDLLKLYDVITLKQILPLIVERYNDLSLNHQSYIYICTKHLQESQAGYPIPGSISSLPPSPFAKVYRISRRIDHILHTLYFINIPLIRSCKTFEKLIFYMNCQIISLGFNQTLFMAGETVLGVYYVLSGQLKSFQREEGLIGKRSFAKTTNNFPSKTAYGNGQCLVEVGSFVGIEQFIEGSDHRKSKIVSNSNETRLLFVKLDVLNRYIEMSSFKSIEQGDTPESFSGRTVEEKKNLYRDIFGYVKYDPPRREIRRNTVKKEIKESSIPLSIDFSRKYDEFAKKHNISNANQRFKKFIQEKNLLFRLWESNQLSKRKFQSQEKENIFEIRRMLEGGRYKTSKRTLKKYKKDAQERITRIELLDSDQQSFIEPSSPMERKVQRSDLFSWSLKKRFERVKYRSNLNND